MTRREHVVIDTGLKIAVFIDFDNIEIGVKTTLNLQLDIAAVLEGIKERGEIVTKVAYGDWKRAGEYGRLLSQHAIRMVQRTVTPGGDKNGADINLALDALEMAFTHHHINAFVIVGGDSDFITLVEKLKQYDKKVFVVGGRQFTSLVMQRNCHEFIAYENLVGGRRPPQPERRPSAPANGAPKDGKESGDIEQIVPLVRRALKVLSDREVSPQLGLLKSTLLQLDSTFSERNYGSSTFRDFAEKLAKTGAVTLRQSGRNMMVDLPENGAPAAEQAPDNGSVRLQPDRDNGSVRLQADQGPSPSAAPVDPARLLQMTEQVRQVFQRAAQPPRWPMYIRQLKQYLRAADKGLEEQTAGQGALLDLVRACQREGILRLERDRRGQMRVFPGAALTQAAPSFSATPVEEPIEADGGCRGTDRRGSERQRAGFAGRSVGRTSSARPRQARPQARGSRHPQTRPAQNGEETSELVTVVLSSSSPRIYLRGLEIPAFDDGDSLRVDVTPERGVDLIQRDRRQLRVHLLVPRQRPAVLFARRHQAQHAAVAGAAADAFVVKRLFGRRQLGGGESLFQRSGELVEEARFHLRRVAGVGDGRCAERRGIALDGSREVRAHAVAQAFTVADPVRQARREPAAAEHVVGQHHRRIIRVIVAHPEPQPGIEQRVLLVGRFDLVVDARDFFVAC